ncbi:MAG TPA: TolC family protein, partial [Thiolapillus brandeum]|nr:TolC family protein [Thiolapillus brandeum]
ASLQAQRALQVLIKAQVASLYFNWRVLGERIAIARKNAKLQKRSLQIARELYQSGNTSELDLQQARTQYLSTLAAIPELQRQRRQTLNSLALTLGRAPGDLPELKDDPGYRLPRVDSVRLHGIPSRLLLRRPDVHAAAWAVAAQSAQIGVAEADLYPAISLVGTLGWSSTTLAGVPDTTLLGVGPSLRWNLFDHGLIRNNVRLQDARLQEALEAYRQTVLTAAREIDDAAISLVKTNEQEKIMEETVATAERALQIAHTSYREGYTDFQRVLDAQRSLFTQNDRLASIRGASLAYLVALYKGLGGGWKPATLDQVVPNATRERMKQRTNWGDLLDRPLPARLPSPIQPTENQETP